MDEVEFWKREWNKKALQISDPEELARGSKSSDIFSKKFLIFWEERFLKLFDPQADDKVLDAGCGNGEFMVKYAKFSRDWIGIDFSENMIKRAKDRVTDKNVKLLVGNISSLPFEDETFDRTLCISVVQYLNDKNCKKALAELIRVTKKGGFIILHFKNSFSLHYLYRKIRITLSLILRTLLKKRRLHNYVYFRSYLWYTNYLKKFGVIEDEISWGIWSFSYPEWMVRSIANIEMLIKTKTNILNPFGKDYYLRFKKL